MTSDTENSRGVYAYHGRRTCYKFPSNIIALRTLQQSDTLDDIIITELSIRKEGKSGFFIEAVGANVFVEHYNENATTFTIMKLYVVTISEVYPLIIRGRYPSPLDFSINTMT